MDQVLHTKVKLRTSLYSVGELQSNVRINNMRLNNQYSMDQVLHTKVKLPTSLYSVGELQSNVRIYNMRPNDQ